MVDDEALVPAVEVFVGVDLDSELLQHGLVGPLAHRVHGGAHVIQDAHDAGRILGSQGKHVFNYMENLYFWTTKHPEAMQNSRPLSNTPPTLGAVRLQVRE